MYLTTRIYFAIFQGWSKIHHSLGCQDVYIGKMMPNMKMNIIIDIR